MSFFSKNGHVLGVSILWNPVSIQAKTDKEDGFKKKYTLLVFGTGHIDSISNINHHFLVPKPLKPLKSNPGGQNLREVLLRDHSDLLSLDLPQKSRYCIDTKFILD